jgi:phosphomannomutase
MLQLLKELRKKVAIGFVGGSDIKKILEQLGPNGKQIAACTIYADKILALDEFDYGFAENGLTAYRLSKPLVSESFIKYVGEENYKSLVNFILVYLSKIDIPIKRYVSFLST